MQLESTANVSIKLGWLTKIYKIIIKMVRSYIDDTVIYNGTIEEFLSIPDQILNQMVAFNVRVNPKKAFLGWILAFLGHIYDEIGVRFSRRYEVSGICPN